MSTDRDSWLRAALAAARDLEPTDAELAPVLAALAARPRRRRLAPRGGRVAAIALPLALVAATAAAAATGLIPLGDVISGEGFGGDERPVVKETVVAEGALKGLGAWRITTFETKTGVDCLKLTLLDARARRGPGPAKSGYCGHVAAFSEFGHGRRAAAVARGEVVLFGSAPTTARSVELAGSGGVRVSAPTHAAPAFSRRYWVLAAPTDLDRAMLAWSDDRDRTRGGLDVSYRFAGPSAPTVVATGTTPESGPWRMTAYESSRQSFDGDVYSPEGLPCLDLRLLDPPATTSSGGGFCGVQPRTPGFTRAQRTLGVVGEPVGEVIMFGHAPSRADAVEIATGDGVVSTETLPGPAGVPGRFWLIARPQEDFADGHVYWIDRDSGERGPRVEVLPP
jgi:hypothetical protein